MFLAFVLAWFFAGTTPPVNANKVIVQVSKFENDKGTCIVCLYDNAKAYSGKGEPVRCATVNILNKEAGASFENLPEGNYAVSVIHDANNNKKFDTNFLGIPTEGYGASQNKLPFAAAPKFDENKFALSSTASSLITIKLRYIF